MGVYVDGYNLYYGGRRQFGRGAPGWKWLSPRGLASALVGERRNWENAYIERVVYCTARADAKDTPGAHWDQDIYLKALAVSGAVDHIEFGRYVGNAKPVPLATVAANGRPQMLRSPGPLPSTGLPLRISTDRTGLPMVLATALIREEKGSDVNVAAHLLANVLGRVVDAAVVISNDSDLALPVHMARQQVPVGVVNPSPNQIAGALRASSGEGVGRHWWRKLAPADYRDNQLPDRVGALKKPDDW